MTIIKDSLRNEVRCSQKPPEKIGLSKEPLLSSQVTAGGWWLWDAGAGTGLGFGGFCCSGRKGKVRAL